MKEQKWRHELFPNVIFPNVKIPNRTTNLCNIPERNNPNPKTEGSFHLAYSEGKGTKLGQGERDLEREREARLGGKGLRGEKGLS